MRVLVADDDPFSSALMEAILRSAGHEGVLAKDGREAWEILRSPEAPKVVFLDWMMPELDGLEVCRRVREQGGADYTYITILSARNKQRDITLGFEAGADEFITKPYKTEDVLARLAVAERTLCSLRGHGLAHAIAEARESPSGDVIVRTLRRVGRIIFHGGKIAWAHVSDEPGSLAAVLSEEPGVSGDDVRAVLAECGASGRNFTEVLVDWGFVSRLRLRTLLREWIRAKLATIAAFPLPVVLFSPENRQSAGGLLFEPDEVLPPELVGDATAQADGPPARARAAANSAMRAADADDAVKARIARALARALAVEGARSAAVFDLRGGQCLGARGEPLDLDLVWSQLRLASQGDLLNDLEDIMISTRRCIHLVRWYTRSPRRLMFVELDRSTPLGLARLTLARCVQDEAGGA